MRTVITVDGISKGGGHKEGSVTMTSYSHDDYIYLDVISSEGKTCLLKVDKQELQSAVSKL